MAVTNCMDCVLAFSTPLVKELVGKTVSFGKGPGIKRVTKVHHLISTEKSLVASLLPLSELLFEKCALFQVSSHKTLLMH